MGLVLGAQWSFILLLCLWSAPTETTVILFLVYDIAIGVIHGGTCGLVLYLVTKK